MELEIKRTKIEGKRKNIAMTKATIDRRPELVEIHRKIKGVETHLANLVKKLNDTKATLESDFNKTFKELDDSSNRCAAEIIKEGKEVFAIGVTLAKNET